MEQHSITPPALERLTKGRPDIPTFRLFTAPLSRCLSPSAVQRKGAQALGLSRSIHEQIGNDHYECLICNDNVVPVSHMWPCQTCSRVFHFSCIKGWVTVVLESAKLFQRDVLDGWRCPQCNMAQKMLPGIPTCWCGKQAEPRPSPGLPPYSCGRACSRASGGKSCCDRPCKFICHAGQCPPCGYQEPLQDMSDQRSSNKTQRPKPKRKFEDIDVPIITHPNDIESAITIDDDDEPQPKRKRIQPSAINNILKETKAELAKWVPLYRRSRETGRQLLDDRSRDLRTQLLRQRHSLGDARRYILDHETEIAASGNQYTPLSALNGLITENKKKLAEVMRQFHQVFHGGVDEIMNDQATKLWAQNLSLQQRHKRYMETRRHILDLAS